MRISDWSSDVCSSDLPDGQQPGAPPAVGGPADQRAKQETRNPVAEQSYTNPYRAKTVTLLEIDTEPREDARVKNRIDENIAISALPPRSAEDRKSTRLNSRHKCATSTPSSART